MDFLKKLFGGGGGMNSGDRGIYFYVQPKMCQEIIQVRVDPMNELSRMDDGDGFYVRKLVSGHRCPFQTELEIFFNKNRNVSNTQITNGTIVEEAQWQAQQPSQTESE